MINAKYTIVLKTLMDNPEAMAALNKALANYPLYKPDKLYDLVPDREALNKRLLNHYKYREIGFETFGRFLDELEITMAEIMPRYNELLKTVVTMAELPSPFDNVDVVETFEEKRTTTEKTDTAAEGSSTTTTKDTATSTSTATAHGKTVETDTPQDHLTIPAKDIDTIPYASKAGWNENTSEAEAENIANGETKASTEDSSNVNHEATGTTTHTHTRKGNQGVNTYAHDMNEFRTSIIDVVDQIIMDPRVAELFMLVY